MNNSKDEMRLARAIRLMLLIVLYGITFPAYAQPLEDTPGNWRVIGKDSNQHIRGPNYWDGKLCAESWTGTVDELWEAVLTTNTGLIELEPNAEYALSYDAYVDAPPGENRILISPSLRNTNNVFYHKWLGHWVNEGIWTAYEDKIRTDNSGANATLQFSFGSKYANEDAPHTLCIDNLNLTKTCDAFPTLTFEPDYCGMQVSVSHENPIYNFYTIWNISDGLSNSGHTNRTVFLPAANTAKNYNVCVTGVSQQAGNSCETCESVTVIHDNVLNPIEAVYFLWRPLDSSTFPITDWEVGISFSRLNGLSYRITGLPGSANQLITSDNQDTTFATPNGSYNVCVSIEDGCPSAEPVCKTLTLRPDGDNSWQ